MNAMDGKFVRLDEQMAEYVQRHRSDVDDTILQDLRRKTAALGEVGRMEISPEQGTFLRIMVRALEVKSAIEVGTFTGYSSLCMAQGLPAGGKLLCLDVSKEWTDIAQSFWQRAAVSEKIELRLGPALDSLRVLPKNQLFDLAFIDAAKFEYEAYYELLLPHIRENGLLIFDNMLWAGRVVREPDVDEDTRALVALNEKLPKDPRVECVMVAFADGLQICRKKTAAENSPSV